MSTIFALNLVEYDKNTSSHRRSGRVIYINIDNMTELESTINDIVDGHKVWYVCTITSNGPYGFRGTSEYLDALVESIGKPKKRPLKPIK